jgi:arginase family enzyme
MTACYGPQFGPDITFLGVPRCDWQDPTTFAGADVVILGAPFDGGTSFRAGTRFGPQYIRQSCYLPHDGRQHRDKEEVADRRKGRPRSAGAGIAFHRAESETPSSPTSRMEAAAAFRR